MDEFATDSLKLAREEISRVMDDLDEHSEAYRNLDDAIQSLSLAIDEGTGPSVEDWKGESERIHPNTSVDDWR